jgi:hypothetical protein
MFIALFSVAAVVLLFVAEHFARNPGPGPTSIYWLAICFWFVALALYATRERARLIYGLLELAIGAFILLGAINSYTATMEREYIPIVGGGVFHRPPEGWLHWNATFTAFLPIAAAIYILVRGLDNLGEGLNELSNRRWIGWWRCIFPKRHSHEVDERAKTELMAVQKLKLDVIPSDDVKVLAADLLAGKPVDDDAVKKANAPGGTEN